MKSKQKYGFIPPEFRHFVERNDLGMSSGPGYERRGVLGSLTRIAPNTLRDYVVRTASEPTPASRPKIAPLIVAMRIAGDMPPPEGAAETLEHGYYLGVLSDADVQQALDVTSGNIVGRIVLGAWPLSDHRRLKLEEFLARKRAEIQAAEQRWRTTFVAQGFKLAGHAVAAGEAPLPVAPPAAPALAQKPDAGAAPLELLVAIIAATLKGLGPMLDTLLREGGPEVFKALRQATAVGATSNGVFETKNKLARLCSARANEISNQQSHQ
jgi:hypothetical protein